MAVPESSSKSSPFAKEAAGLKALRAQAAVEVLVYLGFFLLVFVSLSLMFMLQINQDIVQREYMLSRQLAAQVAVEVDMALEAGPGFNATFPVPAQVAGQPYALVFTDAGSLYVQVAPGRTQSVPSLFYFPISTRRISLGCADPNDDPDSPCPGNKMNTYEDTSHQSRTEWRVNVSDGTLTVANIADPSSGASILQVS
ncbi:MAG: hypothetical protein M1530_00825 [Candidatus Marsarchaeota archaeon]|nr:hypothetical protein [Candidatus Marsarchaeota archaeon]